MCVGVYVCIFRLFSGYIGRSRKMHRMEKDRGMMPLEEKRGWKMEGERYDVFPPRTMMCPRKAMNQDKEKKKAEL
jgi:hypothetical protein